MAQKMMMAGALALALAACGGTARDAAVVSTASAAVPAATAPAMPPPANMGAGATPAEHFLMRQGVKISESFMSRSNLKAIVADNGTERRLFYVAPDGQSLISGLVFDVTGNNITSEDMARMNVRDIGGGATLSDAQLDTLWKRADGLDYIAEGTGRPVYVIFDPNCPYCHRLWGMVRSVAAAGNVQIRWLPVAILADTSKGLGAALYQANKPVDALTMLGTGALTPVEVSKTSADALARNLLLLKDTGYRGVPTMLYQDGGKTRVMMNVPDDQQFASIFGGAKALM